MQPQVSFDEYCHYGLIMFATSFVLFVIGYLFYLLTNKVDWHGVATNLLVGYFFGMIYTVSFFFSGIFLFFALLDFIFVITGVIHK